MAIDMYDIPLYPVSLYPSLTATGTVSLSFTFLGLSRKQLYVKLSFAPPTIQKGLSNFGKESKVLFRTYWKKAN
jgi:hypothetical protein